MADYTDFFVAAATVGGTLWILGPTVILAIIQRTLTGEPELILIMGCAAVSVANGFLEVLLFSFAGLAPDMMLGMPLFERLGIIVEVFGMIVLQLALFLAILGKAFRDITSLAARIRLVLVLTGAQSSLYYVPALIQLIAHPQGPVILAQHTLGAMTTTFASIVFMSAVAIMVRTLAESRSK